MRGYIQFLQKQNYYYHSIKGANISTSKVAIVFGYMVTLFWGFILSYTIFGKLLIEGWNYVVPLLLSMFSIWLLSITVAKFLLNSYTDHMPDLELKQEKYSDENQK